MSRTQLLQEMRKMQFEEVVSEPVLPARGILMTGCIIPILEEVYNGPGSLAWNNAGTMQKNGLRAERSDDKTSAKMTRRRR